MAASPLKIANIIIHIPHVQYVELLNYFNVISYFTLIDINICLKYFLPKLKHYHVLKETNCTDKYWEAQHGVFPDLGQNTFFHKIIVVFFHFQLIPHPMAKFYM